MLIEHDGKSPSVDPTARIAPNAVLCGEVTVGPGTSVGFGAVLTAETGPASVGANCVIMENAVLRGTGHHPLAMGDNVLVGPTSHLSGCTISDNVFVATGASVFNGAHLGARALVRIGAVVHVGTRLPPDTDIPINWIALGDPAEILPPERDAEINGALAKLDFKRRVFGIGRTEPGATVMPEAMARYSRALARHRDDTVL
ncbi:MAG: gamma carbonic anhydrase family protein [Minwuiales bacterium]|nr:gamma carbonic anhydrase family protein [Minwuiales bacterium]